MAGVLQRPKGILSHSNRPILPRVKAVNCFDSSAIGTCQNPDVKSKVEKWAEPTKLLRLSPIRGKGWESFPHQGVKPPEIDTKS